jgi:hypothetical protein
MGDQPRGLPSGPAGAAARSSNPSSGTIESARRALEGTWDLTALEVAPPDSAARVPVQARGTLIAFAADILPLSSIDDAGRVTAIATWHRRP